MPLDAALLCHAGRGMPSPTTRYCYYERRSHSATSAVALAGLATVIALAGLAVLVFIVALAAH